MTKLSFNPIQHGYRVYVPSGDEGAEPSQKNLDFVPAWLCSLPPLTSLQPATKNTFLSHSSLNYCFLGYLNS